MNVIRDPFSSLPYALVLPQEPGAAPQAPERGAAPAGTTTSTGEPVPADGQQQDMGACLQSQWPMLLGFVAIFYFLIIRPGQKTEKARKALLSSIKKGDSVVTNGGLHGVIDSLSDETVTLRVDEGARLTFDRAAITRVVGDEAPPAVKG